MTTLKHFHSNGDELLIGDLKNGTIIVTGEPSRIGVVRCDNVRIEHEDPENAAIEVSGVGTGNQQPLVIAHSSNDVSIGALGLYGMVDDSSKAAWERSVPNGVEVHHSCQNVEIDYVYGRNLHYAVQGRCENFALKGGELEYISGDFIRATRDRFDISHVIGRYSLDVFGYKRVHRDHGQFWQEDKTKLTTVIIPEHQHPETGEIIPEQEKQLPVLTGGRIEHCQFWTPDTGHPFAASSDGFLFSEELYEQVICRHNRIYTNNENALRGGVMRNCIFEDNKAQRADEVTL